MSTTDEVGYAHALDERLAGANLFGWIKPAFEVLKRQWPVGLGAGVVALGVQDLIRWLPWPFFEPWWAVALRGALEALAITLVTVAAYRIAAQRESVGTPLQVNDWRTTLICGVQVAVVWAVLGLLVVVAVALVGMGLVALIPTQESGMSFVILMLVYGAIAVPALLFLLAPLWAILAVANALSTVHAVRGLDNGLSAVFASLGMSFDQKWRVFWSSYVLALLAIGVFALSLFTPLDASSWAARFGQIGTIASLAIGVALTFVIERAYAPDLGLAFSDDGPQSAPGSQQPAWPGPNRLAAGAGAPLRSTATPAGAAPAPTTPAELAAQIEDDLRSNRTFRLVELAERGLGADAKFFASHPDSTTALAKKLVQAERPDLALRLLHLFLKEHRGHRLHLTAALLVANVLVREPRRIADAARFLAQVKTLYPNEPMVDQLIKTTQKAAEAGASGAA